MTAEMPPLILGSGSPRRAEILDQMGLPYEVVRPELDEERFSHGDPENQ